MTIKKVTRYQTNIFGFIQYALALLIVFIMIASLFPSVYDKIYQVALITILIQLIFSLLRLRIINVIFEIFILAFALITSIPLLITVKYIAIPLTILLYVFKFIGLLIAMVDLSTFSSRFVYQKVETYNRHSTAKKQTKIRDKNYKDADFEEK